jgi:uncharacterized membrane protein YsdA (DUF1294 family)
VAKIFLCTSKLLGYICLSVITFLFYAFDRNWRTRENTLHLLSLAGGWPSALIAQQLLRHKTSKESFVIAFWLTVALNVCGFVAWHAGTLPFPLPRRGL